MSENVPDGYMKNALGHLVPRANIREQDLLRDEIAKKVADRAIRLNQELTEFKKETLGELADLIKIAGERYEVTLGGKKGNVSISSYDGKYKVLRSVADRIQFTEEIEAAKALINQCIARWSEGANDNIRAIVDRAFNKDTKGQLKTAAVLDLMRLEINDAEWKRAMDAIRDSIQTTGTAIYVRVYERIGDSDQYKAIPLDLASV
ncbi:MAG: DUF3164 family protein [Comamonas sp.]|uniref:DUF3164 family protein n=1 Tax=Comamonas sp. TaxID=34028 RepID=UPI002FCAAFD2